MKCLFVEHRKRQFGIFQNKKFQNHLSEHCTQTTEWTPCKSCIITVQFDRNDLGNVSSVSKSLFACSKLLQKLMENFKKSLPRRVTACNTTFAGHFKISKFYDCTIFSSNIFRHFNSNIFKYWSRILYP